MLSPLRVMFLGNRRIAWEALRLLSDDHYRTAFDLRVLVTDAGIREHFPRLQPEARPHFISSDARNSDELRSAIAAESIDLLLSVQYNWIISKDILDMVGRRAFNLHNARLPDYKGYNSISHAILNDDQYHESTIHWMDDEVDSGDIAYIGRTEIRVDDTALSLYLRSINAALSALRALLDDLRDGAAVPRQPMRKGAGTFYPRDSVKKLANVSGVTDADLLAKIARAAFFPPYNIAWFKHRGQKFLLLPEGGVQYLSPSAKAVNLPSF